MGVFRHVRHGKLMAEPHEDGPRGTNRRVEVDMRPHSPLCCASTSAYCWRRCCWRVALSQTVDPSHHQRMPPHNDVRPTCVHCNKTTDEHRSITCSVCNCKIHLACLKKARYLEEQGWRSQDPPLYLGQLFNSQSVMACLC